MRTVRIARMSHPKTAAHCILLRLVQLHALLRCTGARRVFHLVGGSRKYPWFVVNTAPTRVYHLQIPWLMNAEIERRRIYDVTNILEALDVVSRKNKNNYIWHGTTHLSRTIKKLRDSALLDFGEDAEIVTTSELNEQPRELGRFFGNLDNQVIGGLVPTGWPCEDGAERASKRSRTDVDSPSNACLFADGLLAYLSSPPHWLYPVHVPHQSAAAAGYSNRGIATLNPVVEHMSLALIPAQQKAWMTELSAPTWRGTVKYLAELASQGMTLDMKEQDACMPAVEDCLQPGWIPDESKLECMLEEFSFPDGLRLQSLPLLSELMCLVPDDSVGNKMKDLPPDVKRVAGGIVVESKRHRRDRSLGVLTQRFLKAFLLDRKVITLDFAASIVIRDDDADEDGELGCLMLPYTDEEGVSFQPADEPGDGSAMLPADARARKSMEGMGSLDSRSRARSGVGSTAIASSASTSPSAAVDIPSETSKKVRRLYDIANVLVALGLLDRVFVRSHQSRRAAFRWRGPAYVVPLPGAPLPEWAIRKISPPLDHRGLAIPLPYDAGSLAVAAGAAQQAVRRADKPLNMGRRASVAPVAVALPVHVGRSQPVVEVARHDAVWQEPTPVLVRNNRKSNIIPDLLLDAPTPATAKAKKSVALTKVPARRSSARKQADVDASFTYQATATPLVKAAHPHHDTILLPNSTFVDRIAVGKVDEDMFGVHTSADGTVRAGKERHVGFDIQREVDSSFSSHGGFQMMEQPGLFSPSVFSSGSASQMPAPSPGVGLSSSTSPSRLATAPTGMGTVNLVRAYARLPAEQARQDAHHGEVHMSPSLFIDLQSPYPKLAMGTDAMLGGHAGCGSPTALMIAQSSVLSMPPPSMMRSARRAIPVTVQKPAMTIDEMHNNGGFEHLTQRGGSLLTEMNKEAPRPHALAVSGVTEGGLDVSMIASESSFVE
jgi:hypothetical protein